MTRNATATLDHVVVTTPNLARAAAQWAALGFALSPRGEHTSLGTANHTAMFADGTYLELLTVTAPGESNRQFQAALERHPHGLGGLALKTENAIAFHAAQAQGRFHAETPVPFGRKVSLPEGEAEARFTIVRLAQDSLPLPAVFACQHHTPELVWRPELLNHPNGASGLSGVHFVSPRPQADAEAFAAAMGVACGRFGPGWAVFCEGPFLGFSLGASLRADALVFAVEDLGVTEQILRERRAGFGHRTDGAIICPPQATRRFDCIFVSRGRPADGPKGAPRRRPGA